MKNPTPPVTLNAPAVVQLLSVELGETPDVWAGRLVNWRRPERQGQAPFKHLDSPRRPRYLDSEIRRYIARMKLEKGAIQADPMDNLPNATAQVIRNQDARLIVQVSWSDTNASGALSLSIAAAEGLAESLNSAITELKAKFGEDFDQAMTQEVHNFAFRSSQADSGELPTLENALRKA